MQQQSRPLRPAPAVLRYPESADTFARNAWAALVAARPRELLDILKESSNETLHVDVRFYGGGSGASAPSASPAFLRGVCEALRANIAETLLVHLITEQGGKEIQHEEYEDILSGPVGRAQ